ncbi:transketolase [Dactylosporangium sp. CA-092794]|uniref:transketolase n=1 Tax=Dactylosporangium sp. CA-092794 TaxID=3239929 RepID=UPI003D944FF4
MTGREGGAELDALAVDTIRLLSADMVEAARSGHPGMPMGCAAMAWALWSRHLRHDPGRPDWPDRDRFVLSAGHGSALLYALLHLFGYDLPMAELRAFRQLGSATPGHPEYGHTPGVETTTGPLGQGLATAVGMALAERMLHARFPEAVDHRTYVIAGDGCLMEGISHEAASLAGHLGLGRLVVLYDDNDVTIDGPAAQSCRDDVLGRFAAYGWHTAAVPGGNDVDAIDRAIGAARLDPRPSLIAVRTVIGYGAPGVAGSPAAHGSPLGAEVLAAARRGLGRSPEPFHVPPAVRDRCRALAAAGAAHRAEWAARFDAWAGTRPEAAARWRRGQAGALPAAVDAALAGLATGERLATRQASARALAAAGEALPELVGGSADLAGSTGLDALPGAAVTAGDYGGRRIHFGIREHAMAAALNGIAAHGGLRPVGSTFLAFSDYLRPALRLGALMRLPVVHVLTHDSIAVGEDGPTHQPVEQIESLRLIPGLAVLRPADDAETVAAWHCALRRTDGPTALILSRQALPPLGPAGVSFVAERGARVVGPPVETPAVTILATGSEVALAVAAAERLTARGRPTRVVSVPWRERFAALPAAEREALTGRPDRLVAVEAGVPGGWAAHAGAGNVLGLDRFGASGPGEQVLAALGFTVDALVALADPGPAGAADGGANA